MSRHQGFWDSLGKLRPLGLKGKRHLRQCQEPTPSPIKASGEEAHSDILVEEPYFAVVAARSFIERGYCFRHVVGSSDDASSRMAHVSRRNGLLVP